MRQTIQTLYFILLLLLSQGCSDTAGELTEENSRGTLTLSFSSGNSFQTRAAHDEDPEYYVGTVNIYFYPGNSTTEAAARFLQLTVNNYEGTTYKIKLSDSEIGALFPDGSDSCTLYALTNVEGQEQLSETATIDELKQIALSTDLPNTDNKDIVFAMDALGTLELDRNSMTMNASLTLKRALAKIVLEISVPDTMSVNGITYHSVQDGTSIIAELYNAATNGLLNGTVAAVSERGFTGTGDNKYTRSYTSITSGESGYSSFTHEAFYSYQNEWESDFENQETAIKLQVPWKKGDANEYYTYYYQIPINFNGKKLTRNQYYKVHLKVGMLGSTVPNEETTLNGLSYEIVDWCEEDYNFVQEINKNHYLVVEDSQVSLWNESEVHINYSGCSSLSGVYLASVSYSSTKHLTNDEPTTVYLYKTSYDASTNSYTKIADSSYGDYDQTVREEYSDVKDAIEAGSYTLTFTQDQQDGVEIGSGQITFRADVDTFAGSVYRPLTYTIVLVLGDSHKSLRQSIEIIQYPSKYIEFGAAGNVFVNGYYGRLTSSANGGVSTVTESNVTYYRSYSFPCVVAKSGTAPTVTYTSSSGTVNNVSYTGYYSTSSNANIMTTSYGSSSSVSSDFTSSSSHYATNSSYEFVRGILSTSDNAVNFKNTVNVYVSAFTSDDHSFTVDNGDELTYEYIIGDPREQGSYVADDTHTVSGYDRTDNRLYDYLVSCGTGSSTQYRRYVMSWGDNAAKIKIGGTTTNYNGVIAPAYKIQSSYGAASAGVTFDVAQKRCATYQEAGYPAGRWRLPTLAEIAFVITLQKEGVIDNLFDDSSGGAYWVSSGGCVQPRAGKLPLFWRVYASNYPNKGKWVRCVYDLWYWGATTDETTTEYHAKPE